MKKILTVIENSFTQDDSSFFGHFAEWIAGGVFLFSLLAVLSIFWV